jgi:ABC-2 type transport system permease protein
MQQFRALLKKEVLIYMRSYLALALFLIYLFVSIGGAFYLGSYLAMHDTTVYAVFVLQPVILILLIPAMTMRLWADEYKSGTAEFLLTQPIPVYKIVMAKVVAAWSFCFVMSLFFLPFVYYTASWMTLDFGNIFLCFSGLWLLMFMFCSLGCLVSAFSNSVILAYLLSVFLLVMWLVFPFTHLQDVYGNFMFAEVGAPDILYFVLFSAVFLSADLGVSAYRRSDDKHSVLKYCGMVLALVCGSIFGYAALYNVVDVKGDFTSAHIYTPKKVTDKIINQVKQPLMIDIYAAKDYVGHNADIYHYYQQITRFLQKYQQLSAGMITVHKMIVEPFSETEEKILDSGLFFTENSYGSRDYFGAIVRNADGKEDVIKQFLPERRMFAEKDIDTAILKLSEPAHKKRIGVYLDATQELDDFSGVLLNLENDYNVEAVSEYTYEFNNNLDLLLLINPKDLPPYFMYAVDQYILRGGKTVIFFDLYTEGQSKFTNERDLQIVRFLDKWGVKLQPEFTDFGVVNKDFGKSLYSLKLETAASFTVENDTLQVEPFIAGKDGYVGAVITGTLFSLYGGNPYIKADFGGKMLPYLSLSLSESKVALVGDVDILNDDNWIDAKSPDKNPYSVIAKAGNGEAVRALIDYMTENKIYLELPINSEMINNKSIGEQIQQEIFAGYAEEYGLLQKKIAEEKNALYEEAEGDIDRMEQMIRVGVSGRSLARDEKALNGLDYKMKREYNQKTGKIMGANILAWPLLAAVILAIIIRLINAHKQQKIKEKFNA